MVPDQEATGDNLGKYFDTIVQRTSVVSLAFGTSGPSCSKLMTSLVNDSLKFTSSDTQIC